jgi:hypothetical protein
MTKREQRQLQRSNKKNKKLMNDLYLKSLRSASFNIINFPDELWITVLSYLPTVYIIKMRYISRLFNYLVSSNNHVFHVLDVPLELQMRKTRKLNRFSKLVTIEQLELYHSQLFKRVEISNQACEDVSQKRSTTRQLSNKIFYSDDPKNVYSSSVYHRQQYYGNKRVYSMDALEKRAYYSISTIELYNLIREFGKYMQHLKLNNCDAVTDAIITAICEECLQLKTLEVRYCLITNESLNTVLSSSVLKNTLEVFDFSGCPRVIWESQEDNKDLLRGFKCLSELSFTMCQYEGNVDITYFDLLNQLLTVAQEELEQVVTEELEQKLAKYNEYERDKDKEKYEIKVAAIMNLPPIGYPNNLFNLYHTLKKISLDDWNPWYANALGLYVLTYRFPNLEHVELYFGCDEMKAFGLSITSQESVAMWNAAKKNTTLKHLSIAGYLDNSYSSTAVCLNEFWELYPALTTCSLNKLTTNPSKEHLETFFKYHKQLEHFYLPESHHTPVFSCEPNSALKTLRASIYDHQGENKELESICVEFFKKYGNQLEVLDLLFSWKADQVGSVLKSIRDNCSNLMELYLRNSSELPITFNSIEDCFLYQIERYMPELTTLVMRQIGISESSAKIISEAELSSTECMKLQVLQLSKCSGSFLSFFKGRRLVDLREIIVDIVNSGVDITGIIAPEVAHRIELIDINITNNCTSFVQEYCRAIADVKSTALRSLSIRGDLDDVADDLKQIVTKAGYNLHSLHIEDGKQRTEAFINEFIQSCPLLIHATIQARQIEPTNQDKEILGKSLEILQNKTLRSLSPYKELLHLFHPNYNDIFYCEVPCYRQ